jgi:hypothetical protein
MDSRFLLPQECTSRECLLPAIEIIEGLLGGKRKSKYQIIKVKSEKDGFPLPASAGMYFAGMPAACNWNY